MLSEQFPGETGSPQERLVRNILAGAEGLEARLSDLLDLARFQTGAFTLEIGIVDATALLKDMASQFQPLIGNRRQSLALDIPQSLPTVKADRGRLGQVLTNLNGNAVKFTPEGGSISLRVIL